MHASTGAHDIPTDDLHALFDLCNTRYFGRMLRPSAGFSLRFSRGVNLSGCFRYCLESRTDWSIEVARRLRDHPRALVSTLTHEMIHMLAHQRYRETGDRGYLDERPLPSRPFVNRGHGAFFLSEMERLNRRFPELGITVKSIFGDALYEHEKIDPVRLLLVNLEPRQGRGMIYRLHPRAPLDWARLRQTAEQVHGVRDIALLRVRGELAEGFPPLRRDNAPRARMRTLSLRHFATKAAALRREPFTTELRDFTRRPANRPVTALAG